MKNLADQFDWVYRSRRQRMSPFPNYLSMESICHEMKETFGFSYSNAIISYKKNLQTVLFESIGDSKASHLGYDLYQSDQGIFRQQADIIAIKAESFLQKLKGLTREQLSNYSNEELADLFDYFALQYKSIYHRYFLIIACEGLLLQELRNVIERRLITSERAEDLFSVLTTEPKAMVNYREEKDRLKIIEMIKANQTWNRLFEQDQSEIIKKLQNKRFGQLKATIDTHLEKYFWITRDYEDPILELKDIIEKIKAILVSQENFLALDKKVTLLSGHGDEIKKAEVELKLSKEEKLSFRAMRDGILLKEKRKEVVSKALYYFDPVLAEVSSRTNVPVKLVRFVKIDEITSLLKGDLHKAEIEKRYRYSTWFSDDKETKVSSDPKNEDMIEKILGSNDEKELVGMAISKGVVSGIVKIMMNPEDAHKIEKGDIIVTVQAVPSFSPAISRAAAILADGGTGLTSHTATLAREAKIPGITGLKVATRLLRDGDLIEVDANAGKVTIIKKAIN